MANKSSSTKKAARLAQQKGGGPKISFQGGSVFSIAIAATLILGTVLILWARATVPDDGTDPPTLNDNWKAAYGIEICDTWYWLNGTLDATNDAGELINKDFAKTGVNSNDDGIIYWKPISNAATGSNATLGLFLKNYGVDLKDDSLSFGEGTSMTAEDGSVLQGPQEWTEKDFKCDDKPVTISVESWTSATQAVEDGTRYTASMNDVRIRQDGMVFAIYVTNDDAEVAMPPWTDTLLRLTGAVVDTTPPADGSLPVVSIPANSTPDASTPDSSTPDASTPDSSTPSTSTAGATTATTATATTEGSGG